MGQGEALAGAFFMIAFFFINSQHWICPTPKFFLVISRRIWPFWMRPTYFLNKILSFFIDNYNFSKIFKQKIKCQMKNVREFFSKKKFVSNDSEWFNFRLLTTVPPPFLQFSAWQHSILRILKKKSLNIMYLGFPLKTANPAAASRHFLI